MSGASILEIFNWASCINDVLYRMYDIKCSLLISNTSYIIHKNLSLYWNLHRIDGPPLLILLRNLSVFAYVAGAGAVENQGVVHDIKFQHVAHHVLDILDARVAEFHHLMAVGTDEVVVLPVAVRFFVLGQVTAKLVLGNQIAVNQYIQGIVNRSTANPVFFIFHRDIQLVHIEVVLAIVNLFKNGKPLGSFPETLPLKVGPKNHLSSV